MQNLILILGLMMPHAEPSTADRQPTGLQVKAVQLGKIKKGMPASDLLKAFGMPSRVDHVTHFYSGKQSERYFYENEPCIYHFTSCSVDVVKGKVVSFRDVKPEYFL